MKKFIAILICSVLLAGLLSGCGSSVMTVKEAYDLYQNMQTAMADVKSMDMDISSTIDMTLSGDTADTATGPINTVTTGNTKEVMNSATDIDMAMNLTTTANGVDTPMMAYYTKGVFYFDTAGMKYKMPMSLEDVEKQGDSTTLNFPQSAIKDFTVTDVDGGKKIEFTLDGTAITDLLNQSLTAMQSISPDITAADLTMGDVTCEAVIDTSSNMLKSYRMACDMTAAVQGISVSMSMDSTITINSFNDVTIDFPTDLDTYVDMPSY
ncbi:MAG: hypothetical protein FWD71_18000 [Oscillospiraceae bacterium]|nr:hypothetical protein [Oscillospiraceae bacterium]